MKKKNEADVAPLDLRSIKKPRQFADLYLEDSSKLAKFFVKHRRQFYKDLPEKGDPFKKYNDYVNIKIMFNIIQTVKRKLSAPCIDSIGNDINICVALYDFVSAIKAFQSVMPEIRKQNRAYVNEREKALNCIEKLFKNRAVLEHEKEKHLLVIKKSLMERPSMKGSAYYPLFFFDILADLGYVPGEQWDSARLQQALARHHVNLNVRFPRNNPGNLFLFQTLQIVVYDLLKKKTIMLNGKKRYHIDGSGKNRNAMELTAQIINSYKQAVGIKGLPVLTEEAIEITLHRNLP